MSLNPKNKTEKEKKLVGPKYTRARRRAKFYNQWTKAERREGMGLMLSLAMPCDAKRYITRRGKKFELIDVSEVKEHITADAKKWGSRYETKVIKLGWETWGLYVHTKDKPKPPTTHRGAIK